MKITKQQLRKIIREEKARLLEYGYNSAVAPQSHFNEREIVAELLAVMDNWREKKVSEDQFILALEEALRVAVENQNENY